MVSACFEGEHIENETKGERQHFSMSVIDPTIDFEFESLSQSFSVTHTKWMETPMILMSFSSLLVPDTFVLYMVNMSDGRMTFLLYFVVYSLDWRIRLFPDRWTAATSQHKWKQRWRKQTGEHGCLIWTAAPKATRPKWNALLVCRRTFSSLLHHSWLSCFKWTKQSFTELNCVKTDVKEMQLFKLF